LLPIADELLKQRDALISEIQQLKQCADEEKAMLTAAHQSELRQLETELNARHEDALHHSESFCVTLSTGKCYWHGLTISLQVHQTFIDHTNRQHLTKST